MKQALHERLEITMHSHRIVHKHALFERPGGRQTLAQLFEGRSRLIICHPMFSNRELLATRVDSARAYLAQHDVTLFAMSADSESCREELSASVFYKDEWGDVFQTWSSSARGSGFLEEACNFLGLTSVPELLATEEAAS